MGSKLYVGNLSFSTKEDQILDLFKQAGTVESVTLIKDRDTGSSKGFAFVEMSTEAEAQKAITMFNNQTLDNRMIRVSAARPREEGAGGGGYGQNRGGGGGYGQNRGTGGPSRGRGGPGGGPGGAGRRRF